jgi:ABC-type polysaccharide/polyol phosphate transport system ATPase subunit
MASVVLKNVFLDYPVFDIDSRSIRLSALEILTGGKISAGKGSKTIVRALQDINIDFKDGDRVGLVGHNGSGKSSLLRVISSIYDPTQGQCIVEGMVRPLLSLGGGLEYSLTGRANIYRLAVLSGLPIDSVKYYEQDIIDFSGLDNFIDLPVRTYSSGMLTRLMFATLTSGNPEILALDEFFSTGDDDFQYKSKLRMEKIIGKANILIFASHSTELLKNYCNRFFKLETGKIFEIEINDL